MPPMPPIPPGIPAGAASFSSGLSAIIASVVTNNPEIDAASCKAVLTTFTGSMIPLANISQYSSFCASYPCVFLFCSKSLPTTTDPSTPAFFVICLIGASNALLTKSTPAF